MLTALQDALEMTSRPFEALRSGRWSEEGVLRLLTELQDSGVIRRIAAVMNHRKLGFTANVMFIADVPAEAVGVAGTRLAHFRTVSHCYERERFEGWPYNLFAMMHGRSMGQIQRTIDRFVKPGDVRSYELLPTQTELKKQPVRHRFL
jgi:DNA-binding Lrp family transcriptional regulator